MAHRALTQCGLHVTVRCDHPRMARLLDEAVAGEWVEQTHRTPDVEVHVAGDGAPFDVADWSPLTRGAYHRDGAVVITDACGSGFDVLTQVADGRVRMQARYRPSTRLRAAALALPWRFQLLARAVLIQYPALWAAGLGGASPLHAAAVTLGDRVVLLAGPGGVGRSTLLLDAVERGGAACTDNLAVSDGTNLAGLVEPVRVEGGTGRRMPHGRRERPLPRRVDVLRPDRLVVLRRGAEAEHDVRPVDPAAAARELTAGTYMAGELRRYWAFAATLALGTGQGPAHPPVAEVSRALADRLPAVAVVLGTRRSPSLEQMLDDVAEAAA